MQAPPKKSGKGLGTRLQLTLSQYPFNLPPSIPSLHSLPPSLHLSTITKTCLPLPLHTHTHTQGSCDTHCECCLTMRAHSQELLTACRATQTVCTHHGPSHPRISLQPVCKKGLLLLALPKLSPVACSGTWLWGDVFIYSLLCQPNTYWLN